MSALVTLGCVCMLRPRVGCTTVASSEVVDSTLLTSDSSSSVCTDGARWARRDASASVLTAGGSSGQSMLDVRKPG